MIQKRNISTFAIGLCLLAFMLLSASPAKAIKISDVNSFKEQFEQCLAQNSAAEMRSCFENVRRVHSIFVSSARKAAMKDVACYFFHL